MIRHDVVQGSYQWHELRLGKVTSSRMKKVMGANNLEVIDEIIAEEETGFCDDLDSYVSEDMQRGIDLEPMAVDQYVKLTGATVEEIGFVQCSELPLLGLSPDRFVGTEGALEVKCPKTKTHVKYIRQNQVPNDYKYQIFTYFLVNPDIQWVDFMSFDPRLEKKPVFIFRTNRSDVKQELTECWNHLLKFNTKLDNIKRDLFF